MVRNGRVLYVITSVSLVAGRPLDRTLPNHAAIMHFRHLQELLPASDTRSSADQGEGMRTRHLRRQRWGDCSGPILTAKLSTVIFAKLKLLHAKVVAMQSHTVTDEPVLDAEDRFVLAAQDLLVSRRRGPGRVIDTSGSFEEFSERMNALRAQRRAENELKSTSGR